MRRQSFGHVTVQCSIVLSADEGVRAMRHNFVNDIGDYAKYALLRVLCSCAPADARLGVLWYLTEHVESNGDGRRRAHLSRDGWDDLDPELLTRMREIEESIRGTTALHLSLIEQSGILPASTAFSSEPLPDGGASLRERIEQRARWFARAQRTLRGCDFIFVDPDNGLEVKSAKPGTRPGNRHASIAEVAALLADGAAVILYQHGDRSPWPAQRARICRQITSAAVTPLVIRSLRFGAFGVRAFFCISSRPELTGAIDSGLALLRNRTDGWDKSHHLVFE